VTPESSLRGLDLEKTRKRTGVMCGEGSENISGKKKVDAGKGAEL